MQTTDYTVFFLYAGGVLAIGLFCRGRDRSESEFFLAGRSVHWLPLGLSIMATMFTAVNYTAFPAEVLGHGLYVLILLPVFLLVAVPVTRVFIPFYRNLPLSSAYEYLALRFDTRVRRLAGALFLFWRLLWMATALCGAGRILGNLTGLEPRRLIVLAGAAAVLYTALGGMRAVIWTDVAQSVVLLAGIAAGLATAAHLTAEGTRAIFRQAADHGLLRPVHPFDPGFFGLAPTIRISFWSGICGGSVALLTRYAADQMSVQRYLAAKSLRDARRAFWLNTGAAVLALLLLALFALAAHAGSAEARHLPPMRRLADLIRALPAGITGLVAAGLLAATMSSVDSGIHACSAVCIIDFRRPTPAGNLEPTFHRATLRGALTTAFGIAAIWLGLRVGRLGSLFAIVNTVVNGMGAPLLALVLTGMFNPRANSAGTFTGGLLGAILALCSCLRLHNLALHYYALLNLAATLAACHLLSLLAELRGAHDSPSQRRWLFRHTHPISLRTAGTKLPTLPCSNGTIRPPVRRCRSRVEPQREAGAPQKKACRGLLRFWHETCSPPD